MPATTPPAPTPAAMPEVSDVALTCECVHSGAVERACVRPATFRVTVVCMEETCDCAVSVHLLCTECLSAWRDDARKDGVDLRVTRL